MPRMQLSKQKRIGRKRVSSKALIAEHEEQIFEEDREKVDLEEKHALRPLAPTLRPDEEGCSKLCGGHCCRRFRFQRDQPPEELWKEYERAMKGSWPPRDDIHLIAPMLVYLGHSHINGNGKYDETRSHWYTCKHLDEKLGLCTIYEHRPRMCRTHGDDDRGRECQYDACEAKKRPLPLGA